jgi:hypothetical protein
MGHIRNSTKRLRGTHLMDTPSFLEPELGLLRHLVQYQIEQSLGKEG